MSRIGTAILEILTDTGKMSAGLSAAHKDIKAFGSKVEATSKQISAVWGAMSAAMGVLALGAVGKEFLDFAGNVADLSQRLTVSTDTVQEWQATFGKASIPIETVAKSSETLSQKLLSGDKSAVAAINAMGLSVDALIAKKPEDRFIAVADAVGQLKNEDDRIAASKGLFGKGGPELLAALDGHLGETIDQVREMGLVIDGETIAAADNLGDQLGLMGTQLLGIVATIIGPLLPALSALGNILSWIGRNIIQPVLNVAIKSAMTLLAGFVEVVTGLLSRLASLGSNIPGVGDKFKAMAAALDGVSKKTGAYMVDLWKQKDATEATGTAAELTAPKIAGLGDASEAAGKKHRSQADDLARLVTQMQAFSNAAAADLGFGRTAPSGGYNPAGGELPGLSELRARLAGVGGPQLVGLDPQTIEQAIANGGTRGLESIGQVLPSLIGDGAQSGFATAIQGLGGILQKAFQGGGGFKAAFQSIGSSLGGHLGEGLFKAGGLLNGLGNKLSGIFGSSLGLALPGIGQVIGSLLGAALPKVWSGIKKLFGGPSEKELGGRDLEKKFEDSFGGFDKMMAKIGDAYAATGRTREQAQRDVKALLDAERQGPEAVQAWIDSLNRVIDEADRATEASTRAAEEAQREIDEVSAARMSAAEAELTTLLDSRKELAAGLAKEADEETKGVIQLQQEAELASLDAQIAQKADAYAQLAQETGQTMADAIVDAISKIQIPPLTVPLNYAGGPSPLPNPYPMAAGGFGTVTKPTLFLAGEAGPEQVAFSGANRAFASGGMDLSTLTAEVAGLRREMAQQVGMAVVHAMAKYGVA